MSSFDLHYWWIFSLDIEFETDISLPLMVFKKYLFYYYHLFLAALGLHCCAWAFSSCGEEGLLFVGVRMLLIAVASLVAEHGL